MTSAELVRVIGKESRHLAKGLAEEMTTNLGTSHYRCLKTEELYQRIQSAYRLLANWLDTKNEKEVRAVNEEIGRARFAEGIPLGQVVLALILAEKHLWNYLQDGGSFSQGPAEEGLRRAVTEFYEKAVHSTGRGYEVRLAESNRLARRAAAAAGEQPVHPAASPTASKVPPKADPAKFVADWTVSRGGQVGECGG